MNKEEEKLLRNTAIISIGKIATQFITFFLLPIYTAVLTKEQYGIVDLLNTLVGLFLPIMTLQIEQGIFRFLIDQREDFIKQKIIISTVFRFIIAQIIIFTFIFIIISPFIKNEYKYFLLTNLIATIVSSMLLQICRGLGDNKTYSIGGFIIGTLTLFFNIIFVVIYRLGAYGMLYASLIANLLGIIYLVHTKKRYKLIKISIYDKKIMKDILRYSIPLVPNMISWWVIQASDRILISTFLGIAQNGIYSTANKFSSIYMTIYNLFNLSWTESASTNIENKDKNVFFNAVFDNTIKIFGSMALLVIAIVPFIFNFFINSSFKECYYQIPILIFASFFNALVSFIGSIYIAKKNTKEIAKTSIFSAIINLVINIMFVSKIGLYAASLSTLIAYFLMFIYRYIDCRKYVSLRLNKNMVISMIIMFTLSIIGYYNKNIYAKNILLISILIYVIIINMNKIRKIITKIIG